MGRTHNITASAIAAAPIPDLAPTLTIVASPSKIAGVVLLLQRPAGATLVELVQVTGWLPHTTRAALTGLRKKGHVIQKQSHDGVTAYSIAKVA
ncbi:MAG: DUF3489 domain-containing protein [Sphingomicrobium sp.]